MPPRPKALRVFERLDSPRRIQQYLDELDYNHEGKLRCCEEIVQTERALCFDGALFAAAALRRLGLPPLLVDLRADRDDDHVIAIFQLNGRLGAIAKSNYVGLRYREPVYKTLRELAMSYFESYFNGLREKCLRAYSRPFDLRRFDHLRWMSSSENLRNLMWKLDDSRHYSLVDVPMIRALSRADQHSFRAGLIAAKG